MISFGAELFKSKFNHAHSTVHNLSTRRTYGAGLLTPKHRLSNLGGVGKVADASLEHGDSSTGKACFNRGLEFFGDDVLMARKG